MRLSLFLGVLGAAVIAVVGFAFGSVLSSAAAEDGGSDRLQAAGVSAVYDCPSGGQVDEYSAGSRVFAVGRTESGQWIKVRNLDSPDVGVWISAETLDPDASLEDLPVLDCGSGSQIDATTTTTTTAGSTTSSSSTTVTTSSTSSTTTAPPTSSSTSSTTSTSAPDTTPPVIAGPSATPDEIWEQDNNSISCPPAFEREADIAVTVTDAQSGVASVTASWTIEGQTTTINLSGGPLFAGVFGPFQYPTAPGDTTLTVDITIEAKDNAGNASKAAVSVDLHSLAECFG